MWRMLFFPMSTINYERFQTLQYATALAPLLQKIWPDHEDQISAAKRHMAFFNTTPGLWLTFIMGISVAQEEQAANTEDPEERENILNSVNVVKSSLMGPMAGIGDSLKATTDAIWGAVSASIAMGGSIMGAIMYEIFEILYYYVLGYYAYVYGYNRGMSFLTDVNKSGILDKLMDAASIVGMMAVGALIPSWCSFNLNHEFIINDFPINLQTELNNIMPGLAPLGLSLLLAYFYSKRVNSLKLVLGLFVAAFLMALIGFGG
ncbi:MAG: PTS system mannose/fructose/sorbose family transporter subunit IID [Erysipelotrichaceae bacterium]|nr:PTS system mannose/fructose/sorbose family transporter subunit IID [Erysipelotrichaceae bacterium]